MKSPRRSPTSGAAPARKARRPGTVRRSVALPAKLVEQVSEAAPPEYRGNLNAIVRTALEEYVRKLERDAFRRDMEAMAADPAARAADAEIARDFDVCAGDGLEGL